jgi:opacity protein-like surface antigen
MRLTRVAPLLFAAAFLVTAASEAQARYVGNLNLFLGRMWLNQGDWAPVNQQNELGLMLAFGEERAPVHFSLDLFLANTDAPDQNPADDAAVSGATTEFSIGVRKVWGQNATHPHLGAGATVMQVSEDRNGPSGPVSNSDRGYGAFVEAGVTWRLASHLNLGLEGRYSVSTVDLGTGVLLREVTAGGAQLGILIGFGW